MRRAARPTLGALGRLRYQLKSSSYSLLLWLPLRPDGFYIITDILRLYSGQAIRHQCLRSIRELAKAEACRQGLTEQGDIENVGCRRKFATKKECSSRISFGS